MVRPIRLMIVGAPKAGTTALLRYLAQHPDVYTHPQSEMVFFVNDVEHGLGYQEAFLKYFRTCPADRSVLIAKHVIAMYSSEAVKRLYEHNPNMHLVVLLRNPVDRAYSSYWYARRIGREKIETFEGALKGEEEVFKSEDGRLREDWLKRHRDAYAYNGIYVRHIETLLKHFGKSQLHVFLTDDMKNNSVGICHNLFEQLNINPTFTPDVSRTHNYSAKARSELLAQAFSKFLLSRSPVKRAVRSLIPNSISYKMRHTFLRLNEKEFKPPPMDPETRARLVEYFRPHNAKLSELLGRDLSRWNQ